jgi:hypothetical protein
VVGLVEKRAEIAVQRGDLDGKTAFHLLTEGGMAVAIGAEDPAVIG